MRFSALEAVELLRQEASLATEQNVHPEWATIVEHFSEMCRNRNIRTHIAFLGTAMLAKALNLNVDVFAIKAGKTDPRAYSARSLGHDALVPHAVELGINLGATGREPLNNQPYFGHDRVSLDMTVKASARPIIEELCRILERLDAVSDSDEARAALRSFIYVRRQYKPDYRQLVVSAGQVSAEQLARIVETFVAENSESGKRAQAVVAGLMDLFAGPDRVETGRINDPDRHLPGDVGVRAADDPDKWERVFEVRDKPVAVSDLYLFADKALAGGVDEAAVVAVSSAQEPIDISEPRQWALDRGLALSLFLGWPTFVEQVMFWSEQPQTSAASLAASLIYDRIVELEVSEEGAILWLDAVTTT